MEIHLTIKYRQREIQQAMFVVLGLQSNLLGLSVITSLKLLIRAHSIHQSGADTCMYMIVMKPGAVPYALPKCDVSA
jgi:hypothetical protein